MDNTVRLLDDAAMRRFITQGYLKLRPEFPEGFHAEMFRQLDAVIEKEGNCGNNILPRVPELQQVFDHPQVRGTLTSILGPGYVMHPHRYAHLHPPGAREQQLHKDTLAYSGDPCPRHHRSRWAMAFYYPQAVVEEMGATGIQPGSQYYDTHSSDPDNAELRLCGEAGTITFVHFDTWHRATENRSDRKRFMLKFIFGRMEDPVGPEWNATDPEWRPSSEDDSASKQEVAWRHLWNWLHGSRGTPGGSGADGADVLALMRELNEGDVTTRRRAASGLGLAGHSTETVIQALAAALGDADEPVRLNAAYALGVIGEPAVPAALGVLCEADDRPRQSAADALAAVGEAAVPALIRAARHADARVRSAAVDALGQIGVPAREAVPTLATALRDESDRVRRHAAEALGTVGALAAEAAPALAVALQDEAPFVRFNAATALTRIGPAAEAAVPALVVGLRDPDRYARAWAAMALQRIGTPEAQEALLEFLLTSRWCPITSPASRY